MRRGFTYSSNEIQRGIYRSHMGELYSIKEIARNHKTREPVLIYYTKYTRNQLNDHRHINSTGRIIRGPGTWLSVKYFQDKTNIDSSLINNFTFVDELPDIISHSLKDDIPIPQPERIVEKDTDPISSNLKEKDL